MKHTITNRLAALLLLAIGVTGCSKEETLPDMPDTARTAMTIRVTDGGYAASDKSTAETRAVENGYATEFTAGDRIGLYVVKPDGSYAHANIALTLTDSGDDKLVWTSSVGTYYDATAKYFAYYPYQSTLTDDLDPSAEDAAGFFVNVVSKWTPATDQSSYALYTAQDLMIGSGTAFKQENGAYPLTLTMTHTMALVVIETPATKYTFTNDNPTIPDYYLPAPDTNFYDFTPYSPTVGTYRYLVKPAQSGASKLMGSYKAGNTKEYEIEQNGIAAASYTHYKVDNGIAEKPHTLQVGDYYMKDGSLVSKDAPLSDAQKAECVGIVFKAGRDDSGGWKDDCNYMFKGTTNRMSAIHGYVLALNDADNGNTCQWGSYGTEITPDDDVKQTVGFYGYKNTNTIKAFAEATGRTLETGFPATYKATTGYETTHSAPDATSGWFLLSAGQCQYWHLNSKVLLNSIKKATGDDSYQWKSHYWSSSEDGTSPTYFAWYLSYTQEFVYSGAKNGNRNVRSVLVF